MTDSRPAWQTNGEACTWYNTDARAPTVPNDETPGVGERERESACARERVY